RDRRDGRRQARGGAGPDGRGPRGEGGGARPRGARDRARPWVREGFPADGDRGEGRLRHRRHGRPAAPGSQGDGRRGRRRRGDRRPRPAPGGLRQRAVLHLLPAAGRVPRRDRGEGARARARRRRREVPVHRERQGRRARRDGRLREGRRRQGDGRAARRPHRGPGGDRDHSRVRRRPHARGDARGDGPHDPRPPDAVRGGARGDARRARPGDPPVGRAVDWELGPEQDALRRRARQLADTVFAGRAARWDASEEYPWENVKDLVGAGLMGMTIPRAYGGPDRPEPGAGSAATDLETRAEEAPGGYRLTGHKCWITGAGTSRLYLVFARFGGRPGAEGIGGLLVERDTPGFTLGRREPMMGLRGIPEGELHFAACLVPTENLLVAPGD